MDVDRELLESVKIGCLSTGVRIDDAAMRFLGASNDLLSIHEYPTTGGLTLELPGSVYVNAPFDEWFCAEASVALAMGSDGLELVHRGARVPVVRQLPLPGYIGEVDEHGDRFDQVAMSHADRVRVSPIVGCAFDCQFCDLPAERYEIRSAERLLSAVDRARADEALPVRHALISGGSPRRTHYQRFEEICVEVVRNAGIPVDVMMSPMIGDDGFVERLAAAGVAGFSINLEVQSADDALVHIGRKFRSTGDVFEEFVARAVAALGRAGRVRSLLIPGLEPAHATLEGVERLASIGCWPVLSPFRPSRGIPLEGRPPPEPAVLQNILNASRRIVASHGVALGPACTACQHNTLSFPWDLPG
jgi:hypothetical protein